MTAGWLPLLVAGLLLTVSAVQAGGSGAGDPEPGAMRVLVFSKTAGYRHDSIPDGIACIAALGRDHGFAVEATENGAAFNDENLARFRVVVFLNTTHDVLNDDQQAAMERYIHAGGGYVGVHAAADTEYDWPWYQKLVGAWFSRHPQIQQADVEVLDRDHPATRHLPARWTRTDEWYDYRTQPDETVHVLMRLDTATYEGHEMGDPHPIAWCHEFEGGRAFYTGGGHTKESYAEPDFVQHLLGGIMWAAGREGD